MVKIGLFGKPKAAVAEKSRESLSFYIQNTNIKEKVEEVSLQIPRTISRTKGAYGYLVLSKFSNLNIFESKMLEEVKSNVIRNLSADPSQIPNLQTAENMAYTELSKIRNDQDSRYFSKIIAYDTAGYGPISILLEDKANMEEIEINGPTSPISIVHSKYGRCQTNMRFTHGEGFRRTINKFIYDSEKELNEDTPIIDAQVGDARLHAQIKPYATNGANATIRLNGYKRINVLSLLEEGAASLETLAYIWIAVECGANIIVSGAPASGKTSVLLSILPFVPRQKRIITIEEDINELKFYPNVANIVQLNGFKSRLFKNTREQAINALRMRPDVLVIGEVRGTEAKELFSGANLGIQFMTTMHSNETGLAIINRLLSNPLEVDPKLVSMLDVSICMKKRDESSKSIFQIIEYKWLSRAETEGGGIVLNNGDSVEMQSMVNDSVFDSGALSRSKILAMYAKINSISDSDATKEIQKRKNFLKTLCKKKLQVLEMAEAIYDY